jgi:hypothetical protein
MGRKSASSFRKCALLPEVADSLPSPTGLYRSDGLTQSNDKAKHGEEPVTDNLPDIVPVTRKEMEVLETYLAALVEEALAFKGNRSKS